MDALTTDDEGGSFRELRERHLRLFDEAVHRHDRGWPHAPSHAQADRRKAKPRQQPKRWKISGILHFPAHHDED
jgi:hypothetical protein